MQRTFGAVLTMVATLSLPLASFANTDDAAVRRIVNDREIKGLHQGAKAKFHRCEPLNRRAVTLGDASSDGTRTFEVAYWCWYNREMSAGQRTRIIGEDLVRLIKLEQIVFTYAESVAN